MSDFSAASSAAPCPDSEYSVAERRWLLRLAHASICAAVMNLSAAPSRHHPQPQDAQEAEPPGSGVPSPHLREKRGAFVTLHKDGKLRGCIGRIAAVTPLEETVREMARSAALDDPRFAPVAFEELEHLALEISVLSPMRELAPEEVTVGRHGLLVSYDGRRGLLLPQVAVHWRWSREMFLAQTCMKAGLPPDAWLRGARIEGFTAEVFGEREPGESLWDL
jgi:uncharacterized protein